MARKFIVDAIKYWMTEYHVDGFRFDLMGMLDRDTMLEVYREAKKINPHAIIYGEGWDMERLLPSKMMMTQANVQGTGIAAFNDGIRDNIKGDAGNEAAPGFVQGAGPQYGGMERFQLNIKGQSTGRDAKALKWFHPTRPSITLPSTTTSASGINCSCQRQLCRRTCGSTWTKWRRASC